MDTPREAAQYVIDELQMRLSELDIPIRPPGGDYPSRQLSAPYDTPEPHIRRQAAFDLIRNGMIEIVGEIAVKGEVSVTFVRSEHARWAKQKHNIVVGFSENERGGEVLYLAFS